MKKRTKFLLAGVFAAAAGSVGYSAYQASHPAPIKAPLTAAPDPVVKKIGPVSTTSAVQYSDFLDHVDAGDIISVTFIGENIVSGTTTPEGKVLLAETVPSEIPVLVKALRDKKIRFDFIETPPPTPASAQASAKENATSNPFSNISFDIQVASLALTAAFVGVFIWQMRRPMGAASRKRSSLIAADVSKKVLFSDVEGVDEAKEDVQEIVDFLKNPDKYTALGAKIPKGVLLVGSPGTGKTLLARAVAGEANVPFFFISGSDFVEMFVGLGAARVRNMFEQANKHKPCIIFIDEIDAVGAARSEGPSNGGHQEQEQTLNQLLTEMDGFNDNSGIIIMAATNRPEKLDPALLRPGRFDRHVTVPLPDVKGREGILGIHMRKVPVAADVDARRIARGTPGFSGAALANLVNEAALRAARLNDKKVTMAHFEDAKDKILMGAENKTMLMSDKEKRLTARHEAGHTIVALHEPESDPIHKVTIMSRGRTLGVLMRLPEGDRVSMSLAKLNADLAVAAGGRLAEEIAFGRDNITTGAQSDIDMITDIAHRMVKKWAMGDPSALPMMNFESDSPMSSAQPKMISPDLGRVVDDEIRKIVDRAYHRAAFLLNEHRQEFDRLTEALIEYETLDEEEIRRVIRGEPLDRDRLYPPAASAPKSNHPPAPGLN